MKRVVTAAACAVACLLLTLPTSAAQEGGGGSDGGSTAAMQSFLDTLDVMTQEVLDRTEPGSPERAEVLDQRDAGINRRRNPVTPSEVDDADPAEVAGSASGDDDSDPPSGWLIAVGAIAVIIAGVIGWLLGHRRGSG